MDIATYINSESSYPLTTEGLDFIQNQILLVQQLAALIGNKVIFTAADGNKYVIIDGEVLPLTGSTRKTGISIDVTAEPIVAQGVTYPAARIVRSAAWSGNPVPSGSGAPDGYTEIPDGASLAANMMPSGAVIDMIHTTDFAALVEKGYLPIGNFTFATADEAKTAYDAIFPYRQNDGTHQVQYYNPMYNGKIVTCYYSATANGYCGYTSTAPEYGKLMKAVKI